jgi:hypothetical protein
VSVCVCVCVCLCVFVRLCIFTQHRCDTHGTKVSTSARSCVCVCVCVCECVCVCVCYARTHTYTHTHTLTCTHTHACRARMERCLSNALIKPTQNTRWIQMSRAGQNHIYTVYMRCFWQGNHQIYAHIRCRYTVLANPTIELYNNHDLTQLREV